VPVLLITAPSNVGPGERKQMLDAARDFFTKGGVDGSAVVRIDVPGRGAGEQGDGVLRTELETMVPLLQSGSLFGEASGLELVDAQNLQVGEVDILDELIRSADLSSVHVVAVVAGSPGKKLSTTFSDLGAKVSISKMWERQASEWLGSEVKRRDLSIENPAREALLQRFGTDTAAIGQALDQLSEHNGKITRDLVLDWFKNRPDEPAWHITDAIERGNAGEALRRLSDFLVHGHPLVFLAAVESDLKKKALAAAAPDEATFKEWVGGRSSDRALGRAWRMRGKVRETSLRRAQDALVRADRVIKSQPEVTHRVTLERLTVALCRWYS
jgi:DNA polymerase III delta subunit